MNNEIKPIKETPNIPSLKPIIEEPKEVKLENKEKETPTKINLPSWNIEPPLTIKRSND